MDAGGLASTLPEADAGHAGPADMRTNATTVDMRGDVADGESSEEEDAHDYENPGMYYDENSDQERDRLFGAVDDLEERETQFRSWRKSIDELELGYM